MKGSQKEKGGTLARWGALLTWLSIAALLLSAMVFVIYMLDQTSSGLVEDDFKEIEGSTWRSEMHIEEYSTISISITSKDDDVSFTLRILDPSDDLYESYTDTTPMIFDLSAGESGSYQFLLTIDNGDDFKDLSITIYSYSFGILFMCCGVSSLGLVFMALIITGFVLLMVAIYQRNRRPKVLLRPDAHFQQGSGYRPIRNNYPDQEVGPYGYRYPPQQYQDPYQNSRRFDR